MATVENVEEWIKEWIVWPIEYITVTGTGSRIADRTGNKIQVYKSHTKSLVFKKVGIF